LNEIRRHCGQSGFSGACIWRVDCFLGTFCLRMWPRNTSRQRLLDIHSLLESAATAELEFVPRMIRSARGESWIEFENYLWELTTWQPGEADFRSKPTPTKLKGACIALARLHLVWEKLKLSRGSCRAVTRRCNAWQEWTALWESGWQPAFMEVD